MDDLDMLREAWGRPAKPDPAARQAARTALLTAAAPDAQSPPRRSRISKLVAAGVAAAAVVAVGVVALQGSGGKTAHPSPAPAQHSVGLMAAQQVLGAAATAAGNRPFTPPRPDQWIYFRTTTSNPDPPAPHTTLGPSAPLHTRIDVSWQNPEATKIARYDGGRLRIDGDDGRGGSTDWMPTGYTQLMSLPRDPAKLLAMFRAEKKRVRISATPDWFAFETFGSMLSRSLVPPEVERAVFQAIALIPGVTVVHNTVDLAGRPAIAINYRADGWQDDQLLLDPKTYAYLGERRVAGASHTDPRDGWTIAKGQIIVLITRQTPVLVDRPGQQPPKR
jgi:hypothetical protein